VFVGNGHYSRQDSSNGEDGNLVVLVGLQLDSHEDVAELRCQWSNATNLELYHDTAKQELITAA